VTTMNVEARYPVAAALAATVLLAAGTGRAEQRPTVKNPVVISVESVDETVAPGQRSAAIVTFRVPKFMWLGAKPGKARTPPGTKVEFVSAKGITFEEPRYPKPSVEGVPARVGTTKVYQGEVRVVVPYRVEEGASSGVRTLTAELTYTPGFNAGKLTTHVNEQYSTDIQIGGEGGSGGASEIPEPSVEEVPESFQVDPVDDEFPPFAAAFGYFNYKEDTALTNTMHDLFLDRPNHGKHIKQVTYPFLSSTVETGQNFGLGSAALDATKEGVMTGALSLLAYYNEFVGPVGGFSHITCPAAYHNLQLSARAAGGDFYNVSVDYENLTLGSDDNWGIQVDADAGTDARKRFYGIGPNADEGDVSLYDRERFGVTADLLHTPDDHFRFGVGTRVKTVDIGDGLSLDPSEVNGIGGQNEAIQQIDGGGQRVPFLEERFPGTLGTDRTTMFSGRAILLYDQRNQEFNPTDGFFGKFTGELTQLVEGDDQNTEDLYAQAKLDLRQYFSTVDQRVNFLLRNQWTLTSDDDVPFHELATLGGPGNLRAFGRGRFHDQHSVFASAEARFVLGKFKMFGFPLSMMMGGFLDVGTVFDEFDTDSLGEDFNIAPGGSMRLVNYPNVGYILNVGVGQDGPNVTGGISLPF